MTLRATLTGSMYDYFFHYIFREDCYTIVFNTSITLQDIKSYCLDIPGDFPYPIIADPKRELAVTFGMIDETKKDDPKIAQTVRALYIISPDHKLRLSMFYPASTGRNVE